MRRTSGSQASSIENVLVRDRRRVTADDAGRGVKPLPLSSSQNAATIDAPQLPASGDSWTTTRPFVRPMLSRIVSRSSGTSVRGSMTSTESPRLELGGGRERPVAHHLRGDHRRIALTYDRRASELRGAVRRQLALEVERCLCSKTSTGSGSSIAARSSHRRQPASTDRDLESGRDEPVLACLRVLRREAGAGTVPEPQRHGQRHLAAGHIAVLRQLVDDLSKQTLRSRRT